MIAPNRIPIQLERGTMGEGRDFPYTSDQQAKEGVGVTAGLSWE